MHTLVVNVIFKVPAVDRLNQLLIGCKSDYAATFVNLEYVPPASLPSVPLHH